MNVYSKCVTLIWKLLHKYISRLKNKIDNVGTAEQYFIEFYMVYISY